MAKRVKIPGRLESAETGNIVTGADAIMDDEKGKTQVVINSEVDAAITSLEQVKQDALTFDNTPTEGSTNPVTSAGVYTADKVLSDAIEAILLLIPSAASALNKLVDMQTMNSSIATATASFKGTYNLVSDLHLGVDATHEQIGAALDALSLGADNNDYAFVQVPNSNTAPTEISKTERFKFNGTNWLYEYDLNNSGFTSPQWNAINSGVTSLLVSKLLNLPTNAELAILLAGKQDNLTFDNVPTAGSPNPVKSGGVYARNNEIVALINALDAAKQDVLTFDNAPVEGSTNPVKSGGVYTAISAVQAAIVALDAAKQNVLTFDSTPTLGSQNPVTSSGIKTELNRIDGNITMLNDLYEALTQSALVVVQPTDTWPVANPEEQTIYRVVDRVNTPPQYYSDYMWNGTAMVPMAEYDNAIDPRPKKASQNLVTSGGVFDNMGALDVSELNATENPHTLAQYVDLSAALAAIPTDYQKGGMSIKFVHSSDNKYVQYRLMSDSFNTTPANWQGVDDEPVEGSKNLIRSASAFNLQQGIKEIDGGLNHSNVYNVSARNGSGNNSANATGIHTNSYIPVGRYGKVTVQFNKTLPSGHYIKYHFYESSRKDVFTGLGYLGALVNESEDTLKNTYVVKSKECVGIVIAVWEYDANNVVQTLRYTDSDIPQDAFTVTVDGGLQRTVDVTTRSFDNLSRGCGLLGTYNIQNGGSGNNTNAYKVKTVCLDIRKLNGSKFTIYTDRPVDENMEYYYEAIFTSNEDAIGNFFANNANPNNYPIIAIIENKKQAVFTDIPNNAVGIVIAIYEVPIGGSVGSKILRVSDFIDFTIGLQSDAVELYSDVLKLNSTIEKQTDLSYPTDIGNGSSNNSGNANGIHTNSYVPAKKGDIFVARLNKELPLGHYLIWTFVGVNVRDTFTDVTRYRTEQSGESINNKYAIVSDDTVGILATVWEHDANDAIVQLRASQFNSGDIVLTKIGEISSRSISLNLEDVDAYSRNTIKRVPLAAACRYRKSSNTSKDLQILIVTDSHADNIAVRNGAIMANKFPTIDAVIHCGDMASSYMTPNDNMTEFIAAMNACTKPWYNVIGNHEAGSYNMVGFVPSIQHMYNVLIKPMVDKGLLSVGEYETGKCHYFHDFAKYNIRMIVVNEYDGDFALDDEYWEPVTYDQTASEIAWNTDYNIGDVVKMPNGYTDYCFRCIKAAHTGNSIFSLSGQEPKYKIRPGERMMSQAQMQWFLNTLASTPVNYSVIVVMHNPFSDTARSQVDKKFSQSNYDVEGSVPSQNQIQNDFFGDSVNAFVNGDSYSAKIVFKSEAAYRNVLNDGSIDYAFEVSKDFSAKNSGVKFMCYLGGHVHRDVVWKHPTYTYQWQITPTCASTGYNQSTYGDIRRSNADGLTYDSITTVAFNTSNKAISLVKIGVDTTDEMEYRDFEKISLS